MSAKVCFCAFALLSIAFASLRAEGNDQIIKDLMADYFKEFNQDKIALFDGGMIVSILTGLVCMVIGFLGKSKMERSLNAPPIAMFAGAAINLQIRLHVVGAATDFPDPFGGWLIALFLYLLAGVALIRCMYLLYNSTPIGGRLRFPERKKPSP